MTTKKKRCRDCFHFKRTRKHPQCDDWLGVCTQDYSSHKVSRYKSHEYNENDTIGDCKFFNRTPTKEEIEKLKEVHFVNDQMNLNLKDNEEFERLFQTFTSNTYNNIVDFEIVNKIGEMMKKSKETIIIEDLDEWRLG